MRVMAADIDPISTSLDPDRIYVLKLAREDLMHFDQGWYQSDTATRRAEEYLKWLQS